MVKFNRRQFIALGAAGAGAALVGNWLRQDISDRSVTSAPVNSAPVYQSSNGLLELDLEASERSVSLGDRQAYFLTYNGQIPAPRLEAKPAGLFIVRGKDDEIPELKAAQEEFLVLQDFSIDDRVRRSDSAHMSLMMGREGEIITANGQVNPSINLTQGGLLRLRILNASPSRFYRLVLEDHAFYHIATDGNSLNKPIEVNELLQRFAYRYETIIFMNTIWYI